jgi:RNA methyltransferase, TrmH family
VITKQQIKYIRSLHQKKYRDQEGVFLAEGYSIVNEALQLVPDSVQLVVCTAGSLTNLNPDFRSFGPRCVEMAANDFSRISVQKSPQEVLAVIKMRHTLPSPETKQSLVLALDQIRDPGNMGTIIRLADWFGISELVCSEDTVDCYNPKVVQASMGAIFRIRISYCSLSEYLLETSRKKDIRIYGTTLDGENLYTSALEKPAIIVLGNEANGISAEVLQHVRKRLLIRNFSDSTSKTESLNVAIAAAITCSEFRRQTTHDYSK